MIPDRFEKSVRIPVKVVNGEMKFFYGGDLPKLKEGTIGDLIVPSYAISDKRQLELLQMEKSEVFLPKGSALMVHIQLENLTDISKELRQFFIDSSEIDQLVGGYFIPVVLETPLEITLRGTKNAELSECKCRIPALLDTTSKSVNHAYSIISQNFEKHRISHTGNVFDKVYFEDIHKKWRKLRVLRDHFDAINELSLIFVNYNLWYRKQGSSSFTDWVVVEKKEGKTVSIYLVDMNSVIHEEEQCPDEQRVIMWLSQNNYEQYDPKIASPTVTVPMPPYRQLNKQV